VGNSNSSVMLVGSGALSVRMIGSRVTLLATLLWQSVDDKVWYSEWMFGWQCITGPDGVIWRVVRLIILVGLGRGLVVQMHINCHQVEVNICGWQVAAWGSGLNGVSSSMSGRQKRCVFLVWWCCRGSGGQCTCHC